MGFPEKTSINRDLVLDFFLVLSRMEFALKLGGYCIGDNSRVLPDWDSFANEISKSFSSKDDERLSSAIDYYLGHPPQKQILRDGRLDWASTPLNNISEIEQAIVLVRRVRNNLFHGGKYNGQSHNETERNEALLQMGIIIIEGAMRCSPSIERAYKG